MAPNSIVSKRLLIPSNEKPRDQQPRMTARKAKVGKRTEMKAKTQEPRHTDGQLCKTQARPTMELKKKLKKSTKMRRACRLYRIVRSILDKYRRFRHRGVDVHVPTTCIAGEGVCARTVLHDHCYPRVPSPEQCPEEVSLKDLLDNCQLDQGFLQRARVSHDVFFKDVLEDCHVPSDDMFADVADCQCPVSAVGSYLAFLQRAPNQGIFTSAGCTETRLSTSRVSTASPAWVSDVWVASGPPCCVNSWTGGTAYSPMAGEGAWWDDGGAGRRSAVDAVSSTRDQTTGGEEEGDDAQALVTRVAEALVKYLSEGALEKMRTSGWSDTRNVVDGAVMTPAKEQTDNEARSTSPSSVCGDDGDPDVPSVLRQAVTGRHASGVDLALMATRSLMSVTTSSTAAPSPAGTERRLARARTACGAGWKRKWEGEGEEEKGEAAPTKRCRGPSCVDLAREASPSRVIVVQGGSRLGQDPPRPPSLFPSLPSSVSSSSPSVSLSMSSVTRTVSCYLHTQPLSPSGETTCHYPLPFSPSGDISDFFSLPPPLSPLPYSPPLSPGVVDSSVLSPPPSLLPCSPEQGEVWGDGVLPRAARMTIHSIARSAAVTGRDSVFGSDDDEDCVTLNLGNDLEVIDEDLTKRMYIRPPLPLSPFNNAQMGRCI